MSSWIEQSARRMLVAGVLAFAVGAPTIACMGGSTTTDEGAGGDEGGGDEGGGEATQDAAKRSLGHWQVQPSKEDMRMLKIIQVALNPKSSVDMLNKQLKPPPTPEEIKMFEEFKKLPPDSPEAQFLKMQMKMLRESNLEITESKWILDMGGEKDEWNYTVVSSTADEVVVKLDSGETNTLTFMKDDKIKVVIKDAGGEMDLRFVRK